MKIGFITADWSNVKDPATGHPTLGGAGWYRCGLPHNYLKANGVEVAIAERMSVNETEGIWLYDHDDVCHSDCDIIVFQRWMHESAPSVTRIAQGAGQKIVQDVDDWYWGLDPSNNAYRMTDPAVFPECNRDHYWKALEAADLITVSTPFLEEQLRQTGVETAILRNGIDLARWDHSTERTGESGRHPMVGWVGSTAHRSRDLETLNGILGPFCNRNDVSFMHGGYHHASHHAGRLAGISKYRWANAPMRSILEYPEILRQFDIGIAPLNVVPFNLAKSYIKPLEYCAAGVPFVATDIAEYRYLHDTYGVGLLAEDRKAWTRNLTQLIDPDRRVEQAKRNREAITELDMEIKWKEWLAAYESLK